MTSQLTDSMRVISSLTGHPKGGDASRDARTYAINRYLDNPRARTDYPVTNVRLRATWIYTPLQTARIFHRPARAAAAWSGDLRPKCVVETVCGRRVGWFVTSMAPPTGFALELCDDCALADLRQPYVYRFFDAQERLLYVGYTVDPFKRFKQHSRAAESQRWWVHQTRFSLTTFKTEAMGLEAEWAAILTEKPLFNRNGVPRAEWLEAAA